MTIQTTVFHDQELSSTDIRILEEVQRETPNGAKRFDYRKLAEKIGVRSWDTVSLHVGRLIRADLLEVDYDVKGIQLTARAKEFITNESP